VNAGNADFGLEAWCDFVRRRVFVEPSVTTDTLGEQRMSKLYKMWALLLSIVSGKRGEVVLYQMEV